MRRDSRSQPAPVRRYGPILLAVGLPFLAYVSTLYPGVGDRMGSGDAIEYQTVGRILSIPHEPGYPQYVLLSHLWSYLPLPLPLATKINLLSAGFAVVAGLFFFPAARRLSESDFSAVLATWMVLLSPDVWRLSTQAEVYTLHLAWVAAVLWAALRWRDNRRQRYLIALFFFYSLAFGNHLTMITLLPGLILLVLATDWRVGMRWQNWLWSILAIVVGLMQYLLLAWRSYNPHPALLSTFPRQANLEQLVYYMRGVRFVDRHFLKEGAEAWLPGVGRAVAHGLEQLTLPFALLGVLGFILLWRRDRITAVFLALTGIGVVTFAASYGIKDALLYTMPAWLCVGLTGAIGLADILHRAGRWRRPVAVALVVAAAVLFAWRGQALRVDHNPTDLQAVIKVTKPGSGILAAFRERRARLLRNYYRYAEPTRQASEIDFRAVNTVFETGLEDSQDQVLYFKDPRTANRLVRSLVDFQLLEVTPDGEKIYVTTPAERLRRIRLRPLWNGSLAITLRDHSFDLMGERTLHLFLFSVSTGRIKGYLSLSFDSDSDWRDRLARAVSIGIPGDRFLLVVPAMDASIRAELIAALTPLGIGLPHSSPAQRHEILWWNPDGSNDDLRIYSDLEEELTLPLDRRESPTTSPPTR